MVRIIAYPNTTDEIFAQAIFNSIACGTALSGDTEVTIYDGRKSPVTIKFQKAGEVGIKLKAVLKIKQEEDIESIKTKANAQITSYLAEHPMGLGETVYASQFIIPLMQTAGIEAVLQIKIATNGDYAEYIEIGQEQIAILTDVVLTENV